MSNDLDRRWVSNGWCRVCGSTTDGEFCRHADKKWHLVSTSIQARIDADQIWIDRLIAERDKLESEKGAIVLASRPAGRPGVIPEGGRSVHVDELGGEIDKFFLYVDRDFGNEVFRLNRVFMDKGKPMVGCRSMNGPDEGRDFVFRFEVMPRDGQFMMVFDEFDDAMSSCMTGEETPSGGRWVSPDDLLDCLGEYLVNDVVTQGERVVKMLSVDGSLMRVEVMTGSEKGEVEESEFFTSWSKVVVFRDLEDALKDLEKNEQPA